MESALLRAIRMFSSCVELALLIGASPQKLDNWLNKQVKVPLQYAIAIEAATGKKVTWDELVEQEVKEVMEHAEMLLGGNVSYSIPYVEIAVNRIKLPNDHNKPTKLRENCFDSNRPICIDENNQLIYGLETLEACKKQGKNKIVARRLSFIHLIGGHYRKTVESVFSLMERTKLGIELEIRIGNRQGCRTDLQKNKQNDGFEQELREKFPEVKEKRTLAIVAYLLGFGDNHRKIYEQAKIVLQYGCAELIDQVNQQKLSISKGANLAKLTYEEQLQKLKPKNN